MAKGNGESKLVNYSLITRSFRVTHTVCLSFSAKDKFSIVAVYKILSITSPGAFPLRKDLGGINEESLLLVLSTFFIKLFASCVGQI